MINYVDKLKRKGENKHFLNGKNIFAIACSDTILVSCRLSEVLQADTFYDLAKTNFLKLRHCMLDNLFLQSHRHVYTLTVRKTLIC